ncbi:hypothetical protein [Corallococcus macrosporus]|uniref:Uncharacterized protein n=1 Tax=Corallococcus macrosporus DSM 14697 TaxID=1189310 RepID=A0A286NVS5_9BACT|nr:hypothetical protein [Corallococcus macrosporus]ATB51270.1 hypothetical protein MYMAC_006928 [Corallococcus macrosporus DSM 14697]
MKKLLVTVTSSLAFLLAPTEAEACGPGYYAPQFVTRTHPDWPVSTFAAGRLGVVRDSLRPAYLVFAYRTMMGIPTTPEEQQPLVTRWERMHGALGAHTLEPELKRWQAARKQAAPQLPESSPELVREKNYAQSPRIQRDALLRAADTATALAKTWKKHLALVEEWVRNQDTVFGPCAILPEPAPTLDEGVSAEHQARRRAERAYQEAASRFYCDDHPGALAAFQRIAASKDSPYRALAAYLVARTHVRQALLERKDDFLFETKHDAVFLARLTEAEQVIDRVLADPELRGVHAPTRGLRSLVRYRLKQETWRCELMSHVLEPGTGSALAAELGDLDLLYRDSPCKELSAPAEALQTWLQTMQHTQYSATPEATRLAQYNTAVARWKKTGHQPWLVAALLKAAPDAPGVPELLAASAKVPPAAPAGVTLAYHAARLLHARGEVEAARARLDSVPAELTRDLPSTDNLLREERLTLARTVDEAMRNALSTVADYESSEGLTGPYTTALADRPRMLSPRSVELLEPRLTAKRMGEIAAGDTLPPPLRRQLMWTAFARATVAGDDETIQAVARRLAETEPKAKAELLALAGKPTPEERQFEAQLLLMGLPAVSARLQSGEDRLANVHPNLNLTMDISYQRNWWCGPKLDASVPSTHFEDTPDAAREWKALQDAGNSVPYFARVAMAWAQAHPEDPRSPIALFRAVRASKRGCGQSTREAREAFRYLHKHYGKTSWAKRTPYVY